MDKNRMEVCLYDLETLGLIISMPSGVFYYNQCGGIACSQNYEEGIFSFIREATHTLYKNIAEYTENFMDGLKEEDAIYIDSLLSKHRETKFLSVDRSRLSESMEAWIYVNINQDKILEIQKTDRMNTAFKGFTSTHGVLTWENSD
jgi:hypothetical protein